jgi:arylsulfatase
MGFEYFYGFMGGETDQWTPFLFRNTTQIFPWREQPGYNLITGMADDAIQYLNGLNASAPDKPFFLYYVPGGTHAPHQPTKEWIEKFKGKFDMGWNAMRDQIFANQKRLGVIPANAKLTPWPEDKSRIRRRKTTTVGFAQRGGKETLCTAGRGLRRLRSLHRS